MLSWRTSYQNQHEELFPPSQNEQLKQLLQSPLPGFHLQLCEIFGWIIVQSIDLTRHGDVRRVNFIRVQQLLLAGDYQSISRLYPHKYTLELLDDTGWNNWAEWVLIYREYLYSDS